MNFVSRAAIKHLESDGHLIFPPGPSQAAQIAQHLQEADYLVFSPYRQDLMVKRMREMGYVVHANEMQAEQAALKTLRNRGARVFLPPSAPIVGTLWSGTRGTSADRLILPCVIAGHVGYRNMATGEDHVTAERSWHRWRTEVRAKVAE